MQRFFDRGVLRILLKINYLFEIDLICALAILSHFNNWLPVIARRGFSIIRWFLMVFSQGKDRIRLWFCLVVNVRMIWTRSFYIILFQSFCFMLSSLRLVSWQSLLWIVPVLWILTETSCFPCESHISAMNFFLLLSTPKLKRVRRSIGRLRSYGSVS